MKTLKLTLLNISGKLSTNWSLIDSLSIDKDVLSPGFPTKISSGNKASPVVTTPMFLLMLTLTFELKIQIYD
jgi:hypothetical protein